MKPKHTNSLIHESSVYLQQHAHNPVNWHAWGDAAFQEAKNSDRPILVSIGYSSCHWCHVMEKESFEDEATATIMNENFINIKVDREERPDLDQIYMDAVQAIAGNGGWPLNVFITPEGLPFYGGTYFPPERAYNKNSWKEVLMSIQDAWTNRRDEVVQQANQLKLHIEDSNSFGLSASAVLPLAGEAINTMEDCAAITEALMKQADFADGGFGHAPKFPQTFLLQYLLMYGWMAKDQAATDHALNSIQKIINGGIYDQVGGGMSRYSTDAKWLVPHFEKMLYDNALLIILLADAFQVTGDAMYQNAIQHTLDFIFAEMKDPAGGYYSAIDADSEGEEGKFYVWDKAALEQILQADAEIYCAYYNVTDHGNWEGKNILHITATAGETAKKYGMEEALFLQKIADCNKKIFRERSKRIRPVTDDKIILAWNALLLKALSKAYAALQHEPWKVAAIELAAYLETAFEHEAGYWHTFKQGEGKHAACLDDLAYWAEALMLMQEITGNEVYLIKAKALMEYIEQHFAVKDKPVYYYADAKQNDLFVRKVDLYDGALPSANAVVLHNLMYLTLVFDQPVLAQKADAMLISMKETVKKYPGSFAVWATAIAKSAFGINEILVTGTATGMVLKEIMQEYFPHKVLVSSNHKNNFDILQDKDFKKLFSIYLCKNNTCQKPVYTLKDLYTLINKNGG